MPVPVINSALKIDESAIHPNAAVEFAAVIDHGKVEDDARNPSAVGEGRGIYGNQTGGGRGHSERNGSFVLRHYYLGPARIKCLETAITSVPVTLGEVSDSYIGNGTGFRPTTVDATWINVYNDLTPS